ncbi:hypothetical protein [Mycobacterium marinum]|uniref:hypothetical protein n=1 Tax=Mycobacterium marinum TaxID=1781 RepID=UPI000B9619C5|nr:hypothetical protein [Mycobacterium marinum]
MSFYPTPHVVGLHVYSDGADDGYGNATPVFTPAKDQAGTEYPVVGWIDLFLPSAAEKTGNMDRTISFLQLFAPASFPATAYDLIDLNGDPTDQWEVVGEPNDYSNGPWWNPGVKMWQLRQVTG